MTGQTNPTAAVDLADVLASLLTTALLAALWLALALRALRLRDEGSPRYASIYRFLGDNLRTRRRAVTYTLAVGLGIFIAGPT